MGALRPSMRFMETSFQIAARRMALAARSGVSSTPRAGFSSTAPRDFLTTPKTIFSSNILSSSFKHSQLVNRPAIAPLCTSSKQGAYAELPSDAERARWVAEREALTEDRLDIEGHPVMQRWETPFMNKLAEVSCRKGGRVVEVGFGMAISATAIQAFPIDEHIILEANGDVFKRLEEFADGAPSKVTPMGPDLWQNTLSSIADESVDGILYDTYPLNKEEQHIHQFEFLKLARRILRPGGIMTYCNLTSLGVLKHEYATWEELFEQTQKPHLLAAGYHEDEIIGVESFPVTPTADCEYYSHDTAMVPIIQKRA